MIGIIGVIILMLSYVVLSFDKEKLFYLMDAIASVLLTIHAIIINDTVFMVVNGFIAGALFVKFIRTK